MFATHVAEIEVWFAHNLPQHRLTLYPLPHGQGKFGDSPLMRKRFMDRTSLSELEPSQRLDRKSVSADGSFGLSGSVFGCREVLQLSMNFLTAFDLSD